MSDNRVIPKGYMTVGEIAKKMGVTVRTLQYYDKEGLLTPSSESEGGRRLYTDKDMFRLHQILSMKHLGFSLNDIKSRLISMDTPSEVANALAQQASAIRKKIEGLSESLHEIEVLREEVLQMEKVNFSKYADIIVNLQMKNELYWLIKHMDDEILEQFRSRFDNNSGPAMAENFTRLNKDMVRLQKEGVLPDSEEAQRLAKEFWDMIMEFTGGNMDLLQKLMKMEQFHDQKEVNAFLEPALEAYFDSCGYDPLGEGEK